MAAQLLELVPDGHEVVRRAEGVELTVYVDETALGLLRDRLAGLRVVRVAVGWEDDWKRFHPPAAVGPLWVGPPWQRAPGNSIPVVIDPGRAFGTGAHATTRLCLELLLELERGSVLDVGCGSGVLAVAAAKLGHSPVTAMDADEAAVAATLQNADANAVRLRALRADALTAGLPAADIALANVDLAVVEALASRVDCRWLVTSGYFGSERPSLPGFARVERRTRERWAADLHVRE
ncbi:MAG: 50S ribosomal protein L11 methyltransferase [Thermoleophilia bacterium]|nr:50S ribosomal protein L11 methyltransferase [Thermoleophilia bacterium]